MGNNLQSMLHLNGNLLCAIDVETTGLDPDKHDIIQVAVVPVNNLLEPISDPLPFYHLMKPREDRLENIEKKAMKVCGINLSDLILNAQDQWTMADRFVEWFESLPLPLGKKLVPLAHNWPFDRDFMINWLGRATYEYVFFGHYRDLMAAALYLNDWSDFHGEPYPYQKVDLAYVCSTLKVKNDKAHDALNDCLATIKAYKALLSSAYRNELAVSSSK